MATEDEESVDDWEDVDVVDGEHAAIEEEEDEEKNENTTSFEVIDKSIEKT